MRSLFGLVCLLSFVVVLGMATSDAGKDETAPSTTASQAHARSCVMNMKVTVMVALAAVLVVALDGPMITAPCPALIQQANEQMADMDDPTGAQAHTAKALVAEADRLHKAGNHLRSIMAVQAALAGFH